MLLVQYVADKELCVAQLVQYVADKVLCVAHIVC